MVLEMERANGQTIIHRSVASHFSLVYAYIYINIYICRYHILCCQIGIKEKTTLIDKLVLNFYTHRYPLFTKIIHHCQEFHSVLLKYDS